MDIKENTMSKLSDEQKNMLRLYDRSKKDSEGWAVVSDQLWPYVQKTITPEMFEVRGQHIRTTDAGKAVLEFAL